VVPDLLVSSFTGMMGELVFEIISSSPAFIPFNTLRARVLFGVECSVDRVEPIGSIAASLFFACDRADSSFS
jgi:hypothetical protein